MLDWDDLRFFLSVQRHGSLSAAARELDVAQSTVGRRLASLETSLGVRLLDRTPEGYVLTPAGHDVRDKAQRLEVEARALERSVGGQDTRVSGLVRVVCAEAMAAHILAPSLAAFHGQNADVLVELIPHTLDLSLAMRDAELSVRLTQPNQHDLVIRRIGSMAFGLYASPAYLESHGKPDFETKCAGHSLIRQLNDVENSPQFGWLADATTRAKIVFQTSSHEAAVSAALEGSGLACLARFRADREGGRLVNLGPLTQPPTAGIWLVVHKDSKDTARIRAVMDHITGSVRALRSSLMPEGSDEADPLLDGST